MNECPRAQHSSNSGGAGAPLAGATGKRAPQGKWSARGAESAELAKLTGVGERAGGSLSVGERKNVYRSRANKGLEFIEIWRLEIKRQDGPAWL